MAIELVLHLVALQLVDRHLSVVGAGDQEGTKGVEVKREEHSVLLSTLDESLRQSGL